MLNLLIASLFSFSLFSCQPGQIDRMLIGLFAQNKERCESEHQTSPTIKKNNIRVNDENKAQFKSSVESHPNQR